MIAECQYLYMQTSSSLLRYVGVFSIYTAVVAFVLYRHCTNLTCSALRSSICVERRMSLRTLRMDYRTLTVN